MEETPKTRIRFRFARSGAAAALSHLEQIKVLRAAVTASGLPFQPVKPGGKVPKMGFGPAIGAGQESACELADAWFEGRVEAAAALSALAGVMSGGFSVAGGRRVPLNFPAVEAAAEAALYSVFPAGEVKAAALAGLMAREKVEWERVPGSGEFRDIRPGLLELSAGPGPGELRMLLSSRPGMTVRPEAALAALGAAAVKVTRMELFWKDSSGKLRVFL